MSSDENFKDPSSFSHVIIALLVAFCAPLLPMVMGWFTMLS